MGRGWWWWLGGGGGAYGAGFIGMSLGWPHERCLSPGGWCFIRVPLCLLLETARAMSQCMRAATKLFLLLSFHQCFVVWPVLNKSCWARYMWPSFCLYLYWATKVQRLVHCAGNQWKLQSGECKETFSGLLSPFLCRLASAYLALVCTECTTFSCTG